MQKSVFFRRVLALLLLALLLWAVLTALSYSFISRSVFTRIKVAELEPKAITVASRASQAYLISDPYFNELIQSAYELFDAWVFVVDGLSKEMRNTALPTDSAAVELEIRTQIENRRRHRLKPCRQAARIKRVGLRQPAAG